MESAICGICSCFFVDLDAEAWLMVAMSVNSRKKENVIIGNSEAEMNKEETGIFVPFLGKN